MIDPKLLREQPEMIAEILRKRNMTHIDLSNMLKLLDEKRTLEAQLSNINEQRNDAAKRKDVAAGKQLKEEGGVLEKAFQIAQKSLEEALYTLPNLLSPDTPIGKDDSENVVLRQFGTPAQFDFKVKDHLELGQNLDLIDTETAGQISGSRFCFLKNEAVLLQFALIQHIFSIVTNREIIRSIIQGRQLNIPDTPFTPLLPPVVIQMDIMHKMGRLLPLDERYTFPEDNQALIGSSEHTMGPMYLNQILEAQSLPRRCIGYSTCFRREAGSYGKDVKGILRQHQFDKLEMEVFSTADTGQDEQELLVGIQEHIMQSLGLPYQVMHVCTGDIGKPDYRQIDIETWIPSQNRYRETHSADYMTDYQARRLATRYKTSDGKKHFVHMNGATALAIGRALIAILENYQQADGSVLIPEVLQKYMNGQIKITPKKF